MDKLKGIFKKSSEIVLGIYLCVTLIAMPYYSWELIKEKGFFEFIWQGTTRPFIKASLWPYILYKSKIWGRTTEAIAAGGNQGELGPFFTGGL